MTGWSGLPTESRLLRLEDLEVTRGTELSDFKREMRAEIKTIQDKQDASQRILISILVAIIVGVVVAVLASQLGGAA